MSEPETPLETARRLWPGEWIGRKLLIRKLAEGVDVRVCAMGGGNWMAVLVMYGSGPDLAAGDLEHCVTTARDKVQSMARDFARAAGVEVVCEAPPL